MFFDKWVYFIFLFVVVSGLAMPFIFTPSSLLVTNRGEMLAIEKKIQILEEKLTSILDNQQESLKKSEVQQKNSNNTSSIKSDEKNSLPILIKKAQEQLISKDVPDIISLCRLSPHQQYKINIILRQASSTASLKKDLKIRQKIEQILTVEQKKIYIKYIQQYKRRF